MNERGLKHALLYAKETPKVYLMNWYKKRFPHKFENAIIETRPETQYYKPPCIADKCIEVVQTRFNETGCLRLGCFNFKKKMVPCNEQDEPQWIQIGTQFKVTCIRACKEHSYPIDTEWSGNKCILINILKKQ